MNLFVDKTDGLYYNNEVVSERRSSVADLTEVYRVKLSVKEVLADSVRLYLQHFRLLALPAFFLVLLQVFSALFSYCMEVYQGNPVLLLGVGTAFIILGFVLLLLAPKVSIALYILIDNQFIVHNKHPLTFTSAMKQTYGKYWPTIGYSLLLGLAMAIPSVALMRWNIPYMSFINVVFFAVIMAYYYFLLPMIAVGPETGGYATRAAKLAKGNYFRLLLLQAITVSSVALFSSICDLFVYSPAEKLLVGLAVICIYFFSTPFAYVTAIVAYRKLVKKK